MEVEKENDKSGIFEVADPNRPSGSDSLVPATPEDDREVSDQPAPTAPPLDLSGSESPHHSAPTDGCGPSSDRAPATSLGDVEVEKEGARPSLPLLSPSSRSKNVLKERFILKNTEVHHTSTITNENPDLKNELKSSPEAAYPQGLSEDEIQRLKSIYRKAQTKFLQKKRNHVYSSFPKLLITEWQNLYPESKLTGKDLIDIHSSLPSSKTPKKKKKAQEVPEISHSSHSEMQKMCKTGKNKVGNSRTLLQHVDQLQVSALPGGAISFSDHTDRQWSRSMLVNLHYCVIQAETKHTDLESEWKILYPNSVLSARNLKSRFTVYERTRVGVSIPSCPVPEKDVETVPKHAAATANQESAALTRVGGKRAMIGPTNDQQVSSSKKIKLTLKKGASQTYVRVDTSSTEEPEPEPERHRNDSRDSVNSSDPNEAVKELQDILAEVRKHASKSNNNNSSDGAIDNNITLTDSDRISTQSSVTGHSSGSPDLISNELIESTSGPADGVLGDDSDLHDEIHCQPADLQDGDNHDQESAEANAYATSYQCKNSEEVEQLPRSKWICDRHYIHVFYDDEDKANECILTEQLLGIRRSLVPLFPGQNLSKPGKKPAGFAKLLLTEWKKYYPLSQENTKTISMKIGRYDRAPQILAQDIVTDGKINWTPNIIENIRTTKEIAEESLGPGANPQLIMRRWKEEWDKLYPNVDIEWKQVMSRYNYHFGGAGLRDSVERELMPGATPAARSRVSGGGGGLDDNLDAASLRGFRQWTREMHEDLITLRDDLLREHPDISPESKEFSRKLLTAFQQRHPSCMESARSLIAKLKDPLPEVNGESSGENGKLVVPTPKKGKSPAKRTPLSQLMHERLGEEVKSDIEGFTDWTFTMVRDFITCMDTARRKYTELEESDPNIKLVPLLLSEWVHLYPHSQETVKTFLVRIRYLKANKEIIKEKLADRNLLSFVKKERHESGQGSEEQQEEPRQGDEDNSDRFTWDSQTMLPHLVATKKKALEMRDRELARGNRVSYAKIWINEFKKIYPNCPYTANNLSVHYAYYNLRDVEDSIGGSLEKPFPPPYAESATEYWTAPRLSELVLAGYQVRKTLDDREASASVHGRGFSNLLFDSWLKKHPESRSQPFINPKDILAAFHKEIVRRRDAGILPTTPKSDPLPSEVWRPKEMLNRAHSGTASNLGAPPASTEAWNPKFNRELRNLVADLISSRRYNSRELLRRWRKKFPTKKSVRLAQLVDRIDDCNLPPVPMIINKVALQKPKAAVAAAETSSKVKSEGQPSSTATDPVADKRVSCLNSKGQMKWTQAAVQCLLQCHKEAVGLKNKVHVEPGLKLADLLHRLFLKHYPECPINPGVLLTKCYIFRSEIKTGKLVLLLNKDGSGGVTGDSENFAGVDVKIPAVSRQWTPEMLAELGASRRRAIVLKRNEPTLHMCSLSEIWLAEFKTKFPDYIGSKKQLLKQFRLYKLQQQEQIKAAGALSAPPGQPFGVSSAVYEEIRAILESSQVVLPPVVTNDVIILAQKWVENATHQASLNARGGYKARDNILLNGYQQNANHAVLRTPDDMVQLPGGALIIAPSPEFRDDATPKNELPDPPAAAMSVDEKHTWLRVTPMSVVMKLSEMGIPLACLPSCLAVYQEVGEVYKYFIQSDLVASWPRLLTERWENAGLPKNLKAATIDSLAKLVLKEAHENVDNHGFVPRSSPPIKCPRSLVAELMAIGQETRGNLRQSWSIACQRQLPVTLRQLVSVFAILEVIIPGQTADDLLAMCELVETWDVLIKPENEPEEETPPVASPSPAKKPPPPLAKPFVIPENVSLAQMGKWYRQTRLIPARRQPRSALRVHRAKNPRLYWSLARIDSLRAAERRALAVWRRMTADGRRKMPLGRLIHKELRKRERCELPWSMVVAKLIKIIDREKRELLNIENKMISMANKEYLACLESESAIETRAEIKRKIVQKRPKETAETAKKSRMRDYNRDEDVIRHIREQETIRKGGNKVWSSTCLEALLKARKLAERRRVDWEAWAVRKHGSLQAACTNPRVKVPKLEELLVEEWTKLRPHQSGLSAWSLNSTIKRFENLKSQLIAEQEREKRRALMREMIPEQPLYFPNSNIPKYNLQKLAKIAHLSSEVKQLILTRQNAMLKQEENNDADSKLHYLDLWEKEYQQENPNWTGNKYQLQSRLYQLQKLTSIRTKLWQAMYIQPAVPVSSIKESRADPSNQSTEDDDEERLAGFQEESPRPPPRALLFPDLPISSANRRMAHVRYPRLENHLKVPVITFRTVEVSLNLADDTAAADQAHSVPSVGTPWHAIQSIQPPGAVPTSGQLITKRRHVDGAQSALEQNLGVVDLSKAVVIAADLAKSVLEGDGQPETAYQFVCATCNGCFDNFNNFLHHQEHHHSPVIEEWQERRRDGAGVGQSWQNLAWEGFINHRKVKQHPESEVVCGDLVNEILDAVLATASDDNTSDNNNSNNHDVRA